MAFELVLIIKLPNSTVAHIVYFGHLLIF